MIPPSPEHENRRILIIDDNAAIHRDIAKILNPPADPDVERIRAQAAALFGTNSPTLPRSMPRGFELTFALQGEEGLNRAREAAEAGRPHALAIVDCRMPPGWDGIETIRHLWKACPDIQVVICTAFSDHTWEEIVAALGEGDGLVILKKPFDVVEMRQLAESMARRWDRNQEARRRLEESARHAENDTRSLREHALRLERSLREADIAAGVVYAIQDLGRILDGAEQSANKTSQFLQNSKVACIGRLAEVLRAQSAHLGAFGGKLPGFLAQIGAELAQERNVALHELVRVRHSLHHIRTTVESAQGETNRSKDAKPRLAAAPPGEPAQGSTVAV